VAAFYLTHNGQRYVAAMHPVGLLLMDAEKIRTEWATGQRMTSTAARQIDQTQSNFDAFAGVIEDAKRRDAEEAEKRR
jgi:hypothetical protein